MQSEKTIQSLFNVWFWNFQNSSLQQFSNLYDATIALIELYDEKGIYKSTLEELKKLFFHPILILSEKYPDLKVAKNTLDWDIAKIEWCYYRDTRFRVKLGKEYFVDSTKIQETKKLLLGEMITILSLFKKELFKVMIQILKESKIDLVVTLPSGNKEIEQIGSESF